MYNTLRKYFYNKKISRSTVHVRLLYHDSCPPLVLKSMLKYTYIFISYNEWCCSTSVLSRFIESSQQIEACGTLVLMLGDVWWWGWVRRAPAPDDTRGVSLHQRIVFTNMHCLHHYHHNKTCWLLVKSLWKNMYNFFLHIKAASNCNVECAASYLNIKIFVITCGEVSSELQDSVSTLLLPSDQEPVLACINGGQVASLSIAVLWE